MTRPDGAVTLQTSCQTRGAASPGSITRACSMTGSPTPSVAASVNSSTATAPVSSVAGDIHSITWRQKKA